MHGTEKMAPLKATISDIPDETMIVTFVRQFSFFKLSRRRPWKKNPSGICEKSAVSEQYYTCQRAETCDLMGETLSFPP